MAEQPKKDPSKQLERLSRMATHLADQLNEAMNSDDEIDQTYLLEAVKADLRALASGSSVHNVAELLANPVS